MSTRASILIKDENDAFWLYRHSDGDPEGTMPTLHKFIEWVREGKIRDNVEESASWLILIGAEEAREYGCFEDNEYVRKQKTTVLEPGDEGWAGTTWKCGTYEFSSGRHGDIEYLYVIDLEEKAISGYYVYGKDTSEGNKLFVDKLFVDTKEDPWIKEKEE